MAERKVLNKYIPPDFDPTLLPKGKRSAQCVVRMMMPFTVCCETCGEFIYRGTKFNSRAEVDQKLTYLGIRIWRFYQNCPECHSEFAYRTDPQNSDYIMEHGAKRNFEPFKRHREGLDKLAAMKEEEEQDDAMVALENRTMENRREMDIMDALEAIKDRNVRLAHMNAGKALEKREELFKMQMSRQAQEDEEAAAKFLALKSTKNQKLPSDDENSSDDDASLKKSSKPSLFSKDVLGGPSSSLDKPTSQSTKTATSSTVSAAKPKFAVKTKRKKKKRKKAQTEATQPKKAKAALSGLLGLGGGSSSSDDN